MDHVALRGIAAEQRYEDQIIRIVDGRLNCPQSIVVDGANILRQLEAIQRPADFLVLVSNVSPSADDLMSLRAEVESYAAEFIPGVRAALCVTVTA